MKKAFLFGVVAILFLAGASARAATTGQAAYAGALPGSFGWNVTMWFEGTWQGILGIFDKQAQIDYINKRISERNTELVGITSLVDAGTFTSSSSVRELQNAHDIAAGAYLQNQADLARAEKIETSPSVFQNAIAYDPESMVDHWMKQRDALLRTELQDQTNGNAANLLIDQADLGVVNQVIAQDDADYASEQEATELAQEQEAQDAQKANSAAHWLPIVQAGEQDMAADYGNRNLEPNASLPRLRRIWMLW